MEINNLKTTTFFRFVVYTRHNCRMSKKVDTFIKFFLLLFESGKFFTTTIYCGIRKVKVAYFSQYQPQSTTGAWNPWQQKILFTCTLKSTRTQKPIKLV